MQFQTLSAAQVPRSRAGFAEAGLDRSESLPLLVLSLAEENLGKIGDSLICRILRLTRGKPGTQTGRFREWEWHQKPSRLSPIFRDIFRAQDGKIAEHWDAD